MRIEGTMKGMMIFFHTLQSMMHTMHYEQLWLIFSTQWSKMLTESIMKRYDYFLPHLSDLRCWQRMYAEIRLFSATLSYPRCVQKVWRNDMLMFHV